MDLSILLAPNDTDVACEIRAFTVDTNLHEPHRIAAHRQGHRDEKGLFLLRQPIDRQANRSAELKIIIPYADLDLAAGKHLLGYEVVIQCAGQPALVRATRLSEVTISDQTRTQMIVPHETVQKIDEVREHSALVAQDPAIKNPNFSRQHFGVNVQRLKTTIQSSEENVRIVGGFERRSLAPEKPRDNDSPYALRDKLAESPTAWQPLSDDLEASQRIVYFATNRVLSSLAPPSRPQFSGEVAEHLTVGKCVVNIPIQQHHQGNLEQPTWWESRDPAKHFLVESIQVVPPAELFAEATAQDVLVYVHGFNTDFEFAVLRTAQLKYDLQFPGSALAMCWPSAASALEYQQDRKRVEQSAEQVADLLQALITEIAHRAPGPSRPKLHLLAHSLGNDLLLRAICLLQIRGRLQENSQVFDQVILAAPDVGALEFNNLLPYVLQHAQRVTYYYCARDAALAASQSVNQYEPVGKMAFFDQGLDTINTDEVDTSFLCHDYYASTRQVLGDLQLLLINHCPPPERIPPLASATTVFGHPLWSFPPQRVTPTLAVGVKGP